MKPEKKNIAFLSYFGHQRRFFAFLHTHLPARYAARRIDVYPLSATPEFLGRFLAALWTPASGKWEAIAHFSRRKYLARHPGRSALRICLLDRFQRAKAKAYYGWFRRHLAGTDLLVLWNGLPLPVAAAAQAAKDLKIATLFCENGSLPKTVTMDPKGVNAGGSLISLPAEFYRAVEADRQQLAALFDTPLVARPLNTRTRAPRPRDERIDLPQAFVFLPLQVHDDSQILMYSPRFSDMPSVVRFCLEGVDAYNRAHGGALTLVVKEHPSDYGRIDYSALRQAYPQAVFSRTHDTADLIAKAKAVVTVNSTVGIEALLRRKPVVTLGRAFYNIPGVVRALNPDEMLADALADALHREPDWDLIGKFLYFLRYEYLIAMDRRHLETADAAEAVRRINDVVTQYEGSIRPCTWF